MTTSHQYCTFFLDGMYFGVEVLKVQEVIRYQEMARVPLAPTAVSGLINLRGRIVPAIDLRRRLGLPEQAKDRPLTNVVVCTEDGIVSLLVDEIGDVQEVEEEAFERPPETLDAAGRALVRGAYKMDKRLLLVLNTEEAANLQVAS